ncbi:hypothetical protein D0469_09010 [Peribacillus saganii]|uniref:Protein-L-IsoD(D-D) O-methyltransferase n=1 Tax=Peribacillus saganii TaxID=2303992 RepID=A0A372LQG8_9BACI|nr:class I SAM-dependent methyltransferase [Peribacillus saganii]RFU69700.1 hypothetical protein D0469_09010 [Peribacillus saganii]
MFVTTAGRTDGVWITKAKGLAEELNVTYVPRKKRSVKALQKIIQDDCLVLGKERLELYSMDSDEPFFFHPNIAMLRIKRLMNGEDDPLISTGQITEGMKILDCTLGLGSDALTVSYQVGPTGMVTGIESNVYLAKIVQTGLREWETGNPSVDESMRRVKIIMGDHLDFLKRLETDSFDIVYFDPMFEERISESDGIRPLAHFAAAEPITEEAVNEAKRIARHKVILKDHFRSRRFSEFGFSVHIRKSAKFHYGVIETNKH